MDDPQESTIAFLARMIREALAQKRYRIFEHGDCERLIRILRGEEDVLIGNQVQPSETGEEE